MGYKIAVVGASGNVGREVLAILDERKFPVSDVVALASARSKGAQVSFGNKDLKIGDLAEFDFRGTDIAFFAAGGKVSKEYAPKVAAAGTIVIDKSSHFRMDPDVPLVVPEVNGQDLAWHGKRNIIATPNCSTIQMVMALKPLHDVVPIRRVVVSTYQSVSGAGKEAMEELFNQTRHFYMNDPAQPQIFPKAISFNVIPQIDDFMDDGLTKEEWKMEAETKKILGPSIKVCAHCVRVPVFIGHGEMVNVEFEREMTAKDAMRILSKAPGVTLIDRDSEMEFITPTDVAWEYAVFFSRVR